MDSSPRLLRINDAQERLKRWLRLMQPSGEWCTITVRPVDNTTVGMLTRLEAVAGMLAMQLMGLGGKPLSQNVAITFGTPFTDEQLIDLTDIVNDVNDVGVLVGALTRLIDDDEILHLRDSDKLVTESDEISLEMRGA